MWKRHLPILKRSANVLKATFEKLKENDGINLDYQTSQKLIDEIIAEKEINDLRGIQASQRNEDIRRVWGNCEKSEAQDLIRDVNTIQIILLPNVDNLDNPYKYQTISLLRYTLKSNLDKIENSDWIVRAVNESTFIDDLDFENENLKKIKYSYEPVPVENVLFETLVILNSEYVKYDENIGLNFSEGNEYSEIITREIYRDQHFKITKDTYEEHIDFLIKAYKKYFMDKNDFIHEEFIKQWGINISFDDLISFMIVLHDYGKLNTAWQKKAFEFQNKKEKLSNTVLLAHTDFNEGDERVKFPPHAGAGALVSISLLEKYLTHLGVQQNIILNICRATASSILRHHSPLATKSTRYSTVKESISLTEQLLKKYDVQNYLIDNSVPPLAGFDDFDLSDYTIPFLTDQNKVSETLLYFYLVRILRICDQKSFEIKEEAINVSR